MKTHFILLFLLLWGVNLSGQGTAPQGARVAHRLLDKETIEQYKNAPNSYPVVKSKTDYVFLGFGQFHNQSMFATKKAIIEIGTYSFDGTFTGDEVVDRIRTYEETFKYDVVGVFVYRENWITQFGGIGGPFKEDRRILSQAEIDLIRQKIAESNLKCKHTVKIIQLLGAVDCDSFYNLPQNVLEHLKQFDGLGREIHVGKSLWPDKRHKVTELAHITAWTKEQEKTALVFMGGLHTTYEDFDGMQQTYQFLWDEMAKLGVDKKERHIVYFRQGARPGSHLPEGSSTTLTHQQKWLIEQVKTFQSSYHLRLSVVGQGSVSISPSLTSYPPGTEVTLTATPEPGEVFTGWSGGASGTSNSVTVTMNEDIAVNASFSITSDYQKLTIVASEASAEENAINVKENSYDGDLGTRWANDNNPDNNWITYDLGEVQNISAVKLMLFRGATRGYPIKIEVGVINESFSEVWSGNLASNDGFHEIAFSETAGRYVRVSMTGLNSDGHNWFSIYEVEILQMKPDVSSGRQIAENLNSLVINLMHGGISVSAGQTPAYLEVINLTGRILYKKNGVLENYFVPISTPGLYIMRLRQDGKEVTRKIVVTN